MAQCHFIKMAKETVLFYERRDANFDIYRLERARESLEEANILVERDTAIPLLIARLKHPC